MKRIRLFSYIVIVLFMIFLSSCAVNSRIQEVDIDQVSKSTEEVVADKEVKKNEHRKTDSPGATLLDVLAIILPLFL